ncbi:MAG: 30S ribosomal protein S6 [bacterium]
MLRDYDAVIIIDPRVGEDQVDLIITKIKAKIESTGGQLENTKKLGKRPINCTFEKYKRLKEGNYVILSFKGESATPSAVTSTLKIIEDVVRYVVTKASELPPIEEVVASESKDTVEVNPSLLQDSGEN